MNKKIFALILIVMFILVFLLFMKSFGNNYNKNDAKIVHEIPSGFIHLPKGGSFNNDLHYVSFESQIAFFDNNENYIYQTGFDNSDFIVKYKGEYYVNQQKIQELINIEVNS